MAPTKSRTTSVTQQLSILGAAALERALRFSLEEIATDCAFDLWALARPRLNFTLSETTARIFRDLPPHELSEAIMRLHRDSCVVLGWAPMEATEDVFTWADTLDVSLRTSTAWPGITLDGRSMPGKLA
jgi:hypothetical protein